MTKFNEVVKIQCLLISQLKSKSYKKISVIPEHQNYELPEKYKDFRMVITKTFNQDNSISIVVEFTDYSKPHPLPNCISEVFEQYKIEESHSLTVIPHKHFKKINLLTN